MPIKLIFIVFLAAAFNFALFAQDEDEIVETSYGEVVSISGNQIIIKEYDYEKYQSINVTYNIDNDVELINLDSLSDLKSGDTVDVDYVIRNNERFAVTIVLTTGTEEEKNERDVDPDQD